MPSYAYCDSDALPAESTRASSLVPNQFHKLCPGAHSSGTPLGRPRCGDGSNFAFFVATPRQALANDRKVLIEFQGGGACWDGDTCGMQQEMLAYPEYFDSFVGMGCSEIEYGMSNQDGYPLSLLCAKEVGGTDFREYNTVVVPYCTQDVHLGDAPDVSYDGQNAIQHVGAHNMVRTLEWVFKNFPNPTHVFLTGCSAGGTAAPVAYDIVNKHYNTFLQGGGGPFPRAVHVSVIMDSSVYLTPPYFLQYGFPNWNPRTIMKKKLHFNYDKHKYDENYPDLVLDHVLRRGSNRDRWGFVTHSSDPISLMYYQYMSGNGGDNGGGRRLAGPVGDDQSATSDESPESAALAAAEGRGRRLDGDYSQWQSEMYASFDYIKKRHRNFDSYIIDDEGHCSFGLYYPLQDDGFEEWASPIVREGAVVGRRRPSAAAFLASLALGGVLVSLARRARREAGEEGSSRAEGPGRLGEAAATRARRAGCGPLLEKARGAGEAAAALARRAGCGPLLEKARGAAAPLADRCRSRPWTAGYLLATSVYFLTMLVARGFAHPLDNPAMGPSAVALSAFGINNSALVVYRMEHFRLVTSSFLCSGIFTFLLAARALYATGLEAAMAAAGHPHWHFPLAAGILSLGINLSYACAGNGASCGSLALALGLNVFSAAMRRRAGGAYASPLCSTVSVFVLGCTPVFPFDSLVALTAGVVVGWVLGLALFFEDPAGREDDVYHNESITSGKEPPKNPTHQVRWNFVRGMGALYFLQYLLLLFRVPSPNWHNVHPYLTGCGLLYSDQIGDFVSAYADNVNNGGRSLGEGSNDEEDYCAQMCIPHLVYRPALWGVQKFASVSLAAGTCEENGYEEHIADKTMREFTVTFEVQLFTASNDDD